MTLLKAENKNLWQIVRIERSCRRRAKSLFNDLKINNKVKKVFFSFNKIQTARDCQTQRIKEKQQATI